MDICDPMQDPYNREQALKEKLYALRERAAAAAEELRAVAEELRLCHTDGKGDWPEGEREALGEYQRLLEMADGLG